MDAKLTANLSNLLSHAAVNSHEKRKRLHGEDPMATHRVIAIGVQQGKDIHLALRGGGSLFNDGAQALRHILSSGYVVVKKFLDSPTANRYKIALDKVGCACAIELKKVTRKGTLALMAIAAFGCAMNAYGVVATVDFAKVIFYELMLIATMFVGIVTPSFGFILLALLILSGCVITFWMLDGDYKV
jgi:hypothetical protein